MKPDLRDKRWYSIKHLRSIYSILSYLNPQNKCYYALSSGHTSYPNVSFMLTNLLHRPFATLFTASKSSSLKSTNFAFPLIRLSLLLFGKTEYPLFNPHAINTCAKVQPFFSAIAIRSLFVLTFSPVPGTWSCEPSGEYATGIIDFDMQYSMSGCCGRKGWISIWFIWGLTLAYLSSDSMPFSVKLESPIDFVRPSLYSFSIARQVGSGFSVRGLLITY